MATFRNQSSFSSASYAPVTPNDSTDLPALTRMVIVAAGGTLVVHDVGGNSITLTLPAGAFPLVVRRVLTTSTAQGITAVY